jgi:hypothetical protein
LIPRFPRRVSVQFYSPSPNPISRASLWPRSLNQMGWVARQAQRNCGQGIPWKEKPV